MNRATPAMARATLRVAAAWPVFIACLVMLAPLMQASRAQAWAYFEHQALGRESYLRACRLLLTAAGAAPEPATVCVHGTPQFDAVARKMVLELLCKPSELEILAGRYGQATALAADHLSAPERFVDLDGQRETVNLIDYALRALQDADHFQPRAPEMWHTYHAQALDRAEAVRRQFAVPSDALRDPSRAFADQRVRSAFFQVVYINAFADHFIQDSFAAGHMAFNRAATRPTASQVIHDKNNFLGRLVRNRLGRVWITHGDRQLHWFNSGKTAVLAAAVYSLYDVLVALATGQRDMALGKAARDEIPIAYCRESEARCAALHRKLDASPGPLSSCERKPLEKAARSEASTRAEPRWVPLAAMYQPAMLRFAPGFEYRHALDLEGRGLIRNQLDLVVSVPISSSYGTRFDLSVGVITSALRSDSKTSLYLRTGMIVPLYASYGSVLSFDLAFGGFDETCTDSCKQPPNSERTAFDRGLVAGYLGPQINVEIGRIVLLQAFVEPFLGVDYGGQRVLGLGFGIALRKGTLVSEPVLFPGPPI
jgi:hypothetical protein